MPFIVPETGSRTRQLVERGLREAGVPLRIAMQMPGTEGVKRAVEAQLGIGMVSGYAVENECLTGVLKRVPIDDFRLTRTMHIVYRAQKYFSPVGARFLEFAKAYGAQHLGPLADTGRRAPAGPAGAAGRRKKRDRGTHG